jgi:threonylcarbamoyladenosine tRNA methylthiotransferase MtaB
MRTIQLIQKNQLQNPVNLPVASGFVAPTEQISPGDLRPKVAILTLGCKVNYSETEALTENFQRAGYVLVEPDGELTPDVIIVNTCTVTHVADRKSRQVLRRAKRENPQALVVATGCYVYTSRAEVEAIPEVDLVVGKADEHRLVDIISQELSYELPFRPEPTPYLFAGGLAPFPLKGEGEKSESVSGLTSYHTRSMVKIQDGCNAGCAFCIVPTARGLPQSVPINAVVDGVKRKVEEGFKEVVLTGVHLGKYRAPSPEGNLEARPVRLRALLEAVLADINIPRLRITSLEPQDYDPTLLELWQQDLRLARHFHLALQSGSDTTLQRMKRGYNLARYRSIVEQIKRELPDASITTDIIVGFPGETDAEFAETFAFAREMGYAKIHVFPYSPREGTLAATMPGQVAEPLKKERGEKLRLLSDELSRAWRSKFIGQVRPVLWEGWERETGRISGLTDNYIRVYTQTEIDLANQITPVKLVALAGEGDAGGIQGEIA